MKRILKWIFFVVVLGLFVWFEIAYWTSTNDCAKYAATPTNPMKAIVYCTYGVGNLKLTDIEKPVPTDDQILVRVHAASVNPYDWHFIEGTPKIARAMGWGCANQRTHGSALILPEPSKQSARTLRSINAVMKYLAEAWARSRSICVAAQPGQ